MCRNSNTTLDRKQKTINERNHHLLPLSPNERYGVPKADFYSYICNVNEQYACDLHAHMVHLQYKFIDSVICITGN